MALPEIKRAEAERDLKKFCSEFVPPDYRNQIRHTYKIRGNDITLIEERPPWNGVGTEWTRMPIARFRYEPDCNGWSVSWQRANGRWLYCDWLGESARFGEILAAVERNDHAVFFG
jgi:hypothetical protein